MCLLNKVVIVQTTHIDTSSDTGNDTGEYNDNHSEIVSAASLAGESGGISCNATPATFLGLLTILSAIIITTRSRRI